MDHVYALPYMRNYHPSYEALGGVPAIQEVQFSIIHNAAASARATSARSRSIRDATFSAQPRERDRGSKKDHPNARIQGYIHDVGGPTANFRFPACKKQRNTAAARTSAACSNHLPEHRGRPHDYLELLRELRRIEGVKKVFVRSGLRYDYMMAEKNDAFFRELSSTTSPVS